MRTNCCITGFIYRTLFSIIFLVLVRAQGAEGEIGRTATTNVAEELRLLRGQVAEQGKRLDRLYRALGPALEELEGRAAAFEQQQKEDLALGLERIADVSNDEFTSRGCASPAAAEFAIITSDGGVRLLDAQGNAGKTFRSPGQVIKAVAFSPNGAELLAGTEAGALLVWDVTKDACITACTNVGISVASVAWLSNDRLAWGGDIRYWEQGGKPVNHDKPAGAVLERNGGKVLWRFRANVLDRYVTLAGSADGQRLVVMEIPDHPRGAFLLDGATGKVLETCYDQEHGSGPLSVGLSPDSRTLAVGYAPYDIILWDARTGERQKLLKGHSNWVVSLAFSADGQRLLSGAGDSTARLWDVASGKEIGRLRFKGESTYIHSVGLSPKGDIVFALTERGHFVVARAPAADRGTAMK